MFLKPLLQRNPEFVQAAVELHQAGLIPANSYVLDLDTIGANTKVLCSHAHDLGLTVYPMTKQIGRVAAALDVIADGGADGFVAVDMACALPIVRNGHHLGHLGHLVQVPRGETSIGAKLKPDFWTVFSRNKAYEVAAASTHGRSQPLLLRVHDDGDEFYPGHEGGISLDELPSVLDDLDAIDEVSFAGFTTFPALLYNAVSQSTRITPNMRTLSRAADIARHHRSCPDELHINAPGTTSTHVLSQLAEAGATSVEPGHGLSGTTPLHAVRDLPEVPAVLYLSEIAHIHQGVPMCFGGGLYVDPVFGDYQVQAVVAEDSSDVSTRPVSVEMPNPAAIDYYAKLTPTGRRRFKEGSSVVFGFRVQAFVTRAFVVGVTGVVDADPRVVGVWNGFGDPVDLDWMNASGVGISR